MGGKKADLLLRVAREKKVLSSPTASSGGTELAQKRNRSPYDGALGKTVGEKISRPPRRTKMMGENRRVGREQKWGLKRVRE